LHIRVELIFGQKTPSASTCRSILCLQKRHTRYCPYLCRILTDFQKFLLAHSIQLAIKQLLSIPPHINCVATLPWLKISKYNFWRILSKFFKVNCKRDFVAKKIRKTRSTDKRHETGRLKRVRTEKKVSTHHNG